MVAEGTVKSLFICVHGHVLCQKTAKKESIDHKLNSGVQTNFLHPKNRALSLHRRLGHQMFSLLRSLWALPQIHVAGQ